MEPDYKNMTPGEFITAVGMDAQKWTDAFFQIFPDAFCTWKAGDERGIMLGWFANAIMAGYDHSANQAAEEAAEESI